MGRLKHITVDARGEEHKFNGKPPIRQATITNLKLDLDTAYFLYPEDAGKLKEKLWTIPKQVTVKWRGVRVPKQPVLRAMVEDKLWSKWGIKASIIQGTIKLEDMR